LVEAIQRCLTVILYLFIGSLTMHSALAQHHSGHHGGTSHRGGHHGSYQHGGYHSGWGHIVPSHHRHSGMYYSYGSNNYYTPVLPPVMMSSPRPQVNSDTAYAALPTPLPEPIAPQSVKLEFGGFQRVDDLSGRLATETNRWCLDMHYNYQHNLEFAVTYRDAYKLLMSAKNVDIAVQRKDREVILSELTAMEPLFHRVQETIKSWTRDENRPVGVEGINGKAEIVESILHHLLYDVGIHPQHNSALEEQAPPPVEDGPKPSPQ